MDKKEITQFMRLFEIRLVREVNIARVPEFSMSSEPTDTATYNYNTEKGYQVTITERQLLRLVSILKQKGYYHDEEYDKRLREEEMILSNPDLKLLHDEYKMLLHLLCNDD